LFGSWVDVSELEKHKRPKSLDGMSFDNIKQEYFTCKERLSYRKGYIDAVKDYAVWRNGEQLVGCFETPIKEALRVPLETAKDLSMWIAQIELDNENYWEWER